MRNLPKQEEIMSSWNDNIENIKVSICCTVYNHQSYIEDAITGFLTQKTNFPFEILIHDDASIDNSAIIIEKYASMYPLIIKPIIQKKNQYSQGVRVNFTYNYLRADGKYIALCEGDDYWTDINKLQSQVDIMEKNKEIKLCIHATGVSKVVGDKIESSKIKLDDEDKIISPNEIILGGGEYGHTSSFLFEREMIIDPPHWYTAYPSGDTPMRLLAASKGSIYYLDKEMSVYRQGVSGSWTTRMKDNNNFINHWQKAINMFNEYDEFTEFKYSTAIRKRISVIAYTILDRISDSNHNQKEIKMYSSLLIGSQKVKYMIKMKFPYLFNILKAIK
ncbi:glycosyltransferase [Oceanobacillus jeddahense]|uniref:glycosyltransferase n=1 Tax=Oceanobacillus jeddahense TaxID=1462527 RepID=UPI000693DB0B|nr:glycosyltransferase [Oceanobacillus jeddahense]